MAFDIRRFWQAREESLPVMVVPYLKDCSNWRKEDTVKAQCRKCAEQLVSHLFKWEKQLPSQCTLKTWDTAEKAFRGMDLSLFQDFIMNRFSVRTPDNQEWLLDRSIAARIWAACVADDSPLPPASWVIQLERRRDL